MIEDDDCEDGYYGELVWSNLFTDVSIKTLDGIVQALISHGFTIPDHLLDNVELDMRFDITNEITHYDQQPDTGSHATNVITNNTNDKGRNFRPLLYPLRLTAE